LLPPPEACAAERTLHAALLSNPRKTVLEGDVATVADVDARENWQVLIAFRDLLMNHPTLEAAYLHIVRKAIRVPHIFLNQLVHVILRNALDGCEDPYVLRAAELFFRAQRMTLHEGSLIAADEETIAGKSGTPTSPLVSMLGIPQAADIDVMNDDNAGFYFEHSDQFHVALDLSGGQRGQRALAEVMMRWVRHLLAIDVEIEPFNEAKNASLRWYIGLDAEGTVIGNRLWKGEDIDEMQSRRIVGLFRLTFRDPSNVLDELKDQPVYLILAMGADMVLRFKPQNLIAGLPLQMVKA